MTERVLPGGKTMEEKRTFEEPTIISYDREELQVEIALTQQPTKSL